MRVSSRGSRIIAIVPRCFECAGALVIATACAHCGGDDTRAQPKDGQAPVSAEAGAGLGGDGSAAASDGAVGEVDATGPGAVGPADGSAQSVDATSPDAAKAIADAGGAHDADAGAYSPCPSDGGACKVLPLGDSITYGVQYAGAYRVQLFQDALNAHQNITFVGDSSLANGPTMVGGVPFPQDNDGHSGWTIDQIAGLVPSPALQSNPDILLLMIGTNDMYSQTQPVAQAPQRLGSLIDKIVAGDGRALLVVAQITPLANSTWEAQVMTYNAAIPALVQARAAMGKHVAMVDMHTGFMTSTMLSSDGVHPNMTGYDHMGDVWYAAIKNVLR